MLDFGSGGGLGGLTLLIGLKNNVWSGLVDVFEHVLPKTTGLNHSMLGSYLIYIDPAPYLEYTRAYSRAYWHVKKRVKIEKSTSEGGRAKNAIFLENPHRAGFNYCSTTPGV